LLVCAQFGFGARRFWLPSWGSGSDITHLLRPSSLGATRTSSWGQWLVYTRVGGNILLLLGRYTGGHID